MQIVFKYTKEEKHNKQNLLVQQEKIKQQTKH